MVSVFQKYNHISWFPMYTKGRTYEVVCTNCRGFDNADQSTLPPDINQHAIIQCRLADKRARLLPSLAAIFWISLGVFALSLVKMFS